MQQNIPPPPDRFVPPPPFFDLSYNHLRGAICQIEISATSYKGVFFDQGQWQSLALLVIRSHNLASIQGISGLARLISN